MHHEYGDTLPAMCNRKVLEVVLLAVLVLSLAHTFGEEGTFICHFMA